MGNRAVRLGTIQILRGAAATLVLISHIMRLQHEQWLPTGTTYSPAYGFGDMGVYVFFVISGFIMYFTSGKDFGEPGAPSRFAVKRLIRIVPLYWVFTALMLISPFAFDWRHPGVMNTLTSFAFLPDASNPPFFTPLLGVGWTLCFEMLFYAVFTACLMFRRRVGLPLLLGIFPALFILSRIAGHTVLGKQIWWPVVYWWLGPQTLLFVAGVALGMVHEKVGRRSDKWLMTAVALLIMVAVPVAPLLAHVPLSKWPLMAVSVGIVGFCALSTGEWWSQWKPLIRLGDASYALYLSHVFVMGALSVAWLKIIGPHALLAFWPVALAASFAAAWMVHVWIEKPIGRALRNWLEAPRLVSEPAPAE